MKVCRIDTRQIRLLATKIFHKEQVVYTLEGNVLNYPTRTSIEIVPGLLHIEDLLGRYINHSFSPSCRIEGRKIIALRDIEVNDEITFNYNENESNMACPFYDTNTGCYVSGQQQH